MEAWLTRRFAAYPLVRLRTDARVLVLALIAILPVALSLPFLSEPMEQDEGVYFSVAMSHGLPYVNVFDHKPPLIYGWYELGLWLNDGAASVQIVRVLAALHLSVAALGVCWIGTLIGGRRLGATAGLLMGAAVSNQYLQYNANTEVFMLPALVFSVGCFIAGVQGRSLRWFVLAGALAGVATMTKQVALINVAAMIFVLRWSVETKGISWAEFFRWSGAIVAAMSIVILGVAAPWLVTGHAHEFWYANISYNAAYAADSPLNRLFAFTQFDSHVLLASLWLWALMLVGVGSALSRRAEPSIVALLAALAATLGGASLTGREYPHYWVPLVPFAAIFAAVAILRLIDDWGKRQSRMALDAAVLLAVVSAIPVAVLYTSSPEQAHLRKYDYEFNAHRSVEAPEVAAFLREHSSPGDRVFNLGLDAQLAPLSGRLPATYFTRPVAAFGTDEDASFERTLRELRERPPRFIVDSALVEVNVTGALEVHGTYDLGPRFRQRFDELIAARYRFVDEVAFAKIYELER